MELGEQVERGSPAQAFPARIEHAIQSNAVKVATHFNHRNTGFLDEK
jgi:hypothetical protein